MSTVLIHKDVMKKLIIASKILTGVTYLIYSFKGQ